MGLQLVHNSKVVLTMDALLLQGQFLQALGERSEAEKMYSTALTLWDQLPDGWLSWGSLCDEMYEGSGNVDYLQYAVSCYLQAVKHGSCAGRSMLPRVLHLLSFDNETGAVGRILDRKVNEVGCKTCLIAMPWT